MTQQELKLQIAERIGKFFITMKQTVSSIESVSEKDGIELLAQIQAILADLDKLEKPEEYAKFRVQFELFKHHLTTAFMSVTNN